MSIEEAAGAQASGKTLVNTRGTSIMAGSGILAVIGLAVFGFAVASSLTVALVGGLIAIIGILAFGYGARESSRWEDLEFVVPEWPLPMGTTVPSQLIRRSKRAVPDRPISVTGEMICRETARYSEGTSNHTVRETVCRIPISVTGEVSNGVFSATLPIFVPLSQGGPTLDLRHNEIDWRVEFDFQELSPLMRDVSFDLVVGPFVRPEIQDSAFQDAPQGGV